MFFTLGLTADVASAHRHEFSSPPAPNQQQHISSPRRPPFPLPRPPPPAVDDPPPSLVASPLSGVSVEAVVRRPGPAIYMEQIPDGSSERAISRSNSTGSIVSSIVGVGGRANSVAAKSKTSYQLAHPPPGVHRPRLGVKPKLLLQLQRLSGSARPIPALDILPSTILAPRLARKFPRFFSGKDGFGPSDILVLTSEDYASSASNGADASENLEDDNLGTRQLVAAICQMRKGEGAGRGKAEICLGCGSTWEATPLLNGGYELVTKGTDGSISTVRWVQRKPTHRRRSSTLQPSTSIRPEEYEKKFTFSIISPDTRRHPIIASMNRNTIDISDYYSTSSSSSGAYTPTSPARSPSVECSHISFFEPHERTLTRIDEGLKNLILVSGTWVAFREGWSQNFKYDDASTPPPINIPPGPPNGTHPLRCASMPPSMLENSRQTKTDDFGNHPNALQGVSGRLLRSGGHLLHRSSASQASSPISPRENGFPRPRRSNSTGAAFLQRGHNRNTSRVSEFSANSPSTPLERREVESRASPPPATPTQQRRVIAQTDGSMVDRDPITSTPATGHDGAPRRRVQSEYYPKDIDGAAGGFLVGGEQRKEEGEKKRWGRLKSLFNIVRRTGGVQSPQQR
ncbi:hypothetical protein FGG08_001315 [Glutinoglossum americanum]|uniref:Uncharacterized protein n=1 Tax=Glutinoglossum americanum TaxID=1670608 RepID=A0A9P8L0C9_9PEZI|nr:hypothetical protein FGG08_001315 [Glutinoglossum americanum]